MNVIDLKRIIKNLPDDCPVYLWDVGIGGTVYNVAAEYREEECVEHSGKHHIKKGLMIESEPETLKFMSIEID